MIDLETFKLFSRASINKYLLLYHKDGENILNDENEILKLCEDVTYHKGMLIYMTLRIPWSVQRPFSETKNLNDTFCIPQVPIVCNVP